jgi:hypothetical protein
MYHKVIHSSRCAFVLFALLLGLALSACGAAPSGQAASQAGTSGPLPKLDSCELLTQADAEALLGAPVAAPDTNHVESDDPADARAMSQCLYNTTGSEYKSVSILVRRANTPEESRAGLDQIREHNALGGTMEPVAGLGDAALWNHGGDDDQLNVTKGQFLVIAGANLGKGVPTLDISKAAAQRVLARLP